MTTVNGADAANPMNYARQQNNSLMAETQDRFLTLLITQMQNQDPMNPMDNAQVTSQIAQMSTVQGIQDLNNTLLAVSGQLDVSQSMQAAALIGKDVLVPGNKIKVGSDAEDSSIKSTTGFGVDVASPASRVIISITDQAGRVVRQLELEDMKLGVHNVEWDGLDDAGNPVPDAAYNTKVEAFDAEGKAVNAEMLTSGKVASVSYSTKGLLLDLGLTGTYSLLDIRKIM